MSASSNRPAIERIDDLALEQLQPLIEASTGEGFGMLRQLADEWQAGSNRFARPGEVLLGARLPDRIVGVCGLNVDPYAANPRTGRVRRLFVEVESRRRGVGRSLVDAIIDEARLSFDLLRLRTTNPGAASFYEVLGFRRCWDVENCTHVLDL